jgi:hypothetical protein
MRTLMAELRARGAELEADRRRVDGRIEAFERRLSAREEEGEGEAAAAAAAARQRQQQHHHY